MIKIENYPKIPKFPRNFPKKTRKFNGKISETPKNLPTSFARRMGGYFPKHFSRRGILAIPTPLKHVWLTTTVCNIAGMDYTFECIGNVKSIETAFKSLNRWGVCVVIGLPPRGQQVSVDPWSLLSGQKLTGSFYGGFKPREGITHLMDRYLSGKLSLDMFVTHRIKLEDINSGIDLMRRGLTVRAVINNDI